MRTPLPSTEKRSRLRYSACVRRRLLDRCRLRAGGRSGVGRHGKGKVVGEWGRSMNIEVVASGYGIEVCNACAYGTVSGRMVRWIRQRARRNGAECKERTLLAVARRMTWGTSGMVALCVRLLKRTLVGALVRSDGGRKCRLEDERWRQGHGIGEHGGRRCAWVIREVWWENRKVWISGCTVRGPGSIRGLPRILGLRRD